MSMEPTIQWNAYPGLLACSFFAVGIGAAELTDIPLRAWAVVALGALVCALATLTGRRPMVNVRDGSLQTAAAIAALVAAGALRHMSVAAIPANHVLHRVSETRFSVSGWILDAPVDATAGKRFVLRVDPATGYRGLLQVTIDGWKGAELDACDRVRVTGRAAPLPLMRNPGDFDYGRHLARRRIYTRLYVDAADVATSGRRRDGVRCLAHGMRKAIGSRLDDYVPREDSRAVLRALLLGERGMLDPEIRNQFVRTGLLHLLAVSGLHVMVVGLAVYRLLQPSLMRAGLQWHTVEVTRCAVTALLLVGYAVLTGGSASVVRAVVMTLLFMSANVLQRASHAQNTLGIAMLVLLVMRPAHLFEPGFQLSSAAVASIVSVTPQIHHWVAPPTVRPARYVHASIVVTAAASLGTLPIVLYHFGQAAFAGLILNLPAVPITSVLLSSGVAALSAGAILPSAGAALGTSADLFARALLAVTTFGDRFLGWSVLRWDIEGTTVVIAVSFGVIAIASWQFPRRRWRSVAAALLVAAVHLWARIGDGSYGPHVDVLYLDVGQGDAAVIRWSDGTAVLIDAGPRTPFTDAGERVVLPQLRRLGVERLELIVISHPDSDHLGGLPALLQSMPIGRVVRSGYVTDSNLYRETGERLDSLGVSDETVRTGDTLAVRPDARLYVFHPDRLLPAVPSNGHSVVVQLHYGRTRFLFTGDAPGDVERFVVRTFGNLAASEVLKVGHHGSRTSSTPVFLQNVYSEGAFGIISASRNNRFGLPHGDVVDRLRTVGFDLRTTVDGAVWIRSNGSHLRSVDWRNDQ